jgi:hypothetical protein
MPKETASSEEVLAAAGTTKVKATFVQLAGLWLAAGVGAIIAVVTVAVIVFVYVHYPIIPSTEALKEAADSKIAIEQYKELSQIAIKNGQDLFQTIVTQALLPVLTAILGYIFGKSDKPE